MRREEDRDGNALILCVNHACASNGGTNSERLRLAAPLTGEAHFIDRDLFLKYVAEEVNPARAENHLPLVEDGAASHLYDVITSRRYRR